ncbi:hypothetical protein NQZ79_g3646 [Umbelopsis isabellina]|nr:hypothetical protein NQZ79_g3646 [Umbelopsis isabellina]
MIRVNLKWSLPIHSFTKKILLARHCRVEHAATMSRVRRTSSNGSEQDTYYDVTNSSSPSLASPKQPSPPYDYDSHCDMSCKGASEWTSFYHYVNPPATDIIDGIRSIPYFSPTNPIYINAPPMGPISRTAMTCFVEEKKKNNKKAITRNTPSQEE